jgi:transcription antitermination factor NusG
MQKGAPRSFAIVSSPFHRYDDGDMQNWKVLFVKPRTEKKVVEYCRLYEIPSYLPLREKTSVHQRRKVTTQLPVFPGYVFVNLDAAHRIQLLQTNLLVRILEPPKPRRMLRDLVMVRRALRINPALTATQALTRGRKARITKGAFMGIEGRVDRLLGRLKVVLNVDLIGQAIAVTVEADQIDLL